MVLVHVEPRRAETGAIGDGEKGQTADRGRGEGAKERGEMQNKK